MPVATQSGICWQGGWRIWLRLKLEDALFEQQCRGAGRHYICAKRTAKD